MAMARDEKDRIEQQAIDEAPGERSEQWKQSVEDRLDGIEKRLKNVPHY